MPKPNQSRFLIFRFRDSLEANVVTVVTICTDHRISTYRLPVLNQPSARLRQESRTGRPDGDAAAAPEHRQSKAELAKDSSKLEGGEVFMCLSYPSN